LAVEGGVSGAETLRDYRGEVVVGESRVDLLFLGEGGLAPIIAFDFLLQNLNQNYERLQTPPRGRFC
jgi:hypothetical protein